MFFHDHRVHFSHRDCRDEADHFFGRRRHGRHGGSDRGREGRVFDHGDLRLVIMALLAEQPRYGYDVIKVLEERVGGGYSPSPGVVYPTLTLLEEMGHASVAEERGRKLYTLTSEGQAYLDDHRTTLNAILARTKAGAEARRGPPLPVLRATENLMAAVRLRFKGQVMTQAQIDAAAAAIDAAARTVEGL